MVDDGVLFILIKLFYIDLFGNGVDCCFCWFVVIDEICMGVYVMKFVDIGCNDFFIVEYY